jgi:uridine kinase
MITILILFGSARTANLACNREFGLMESYVIGVAGGTGAGKTTLAEGLAVAIGPGHAVVVHEDRYYRDNSHLSAALRENLNYDHPDAIDLDLLTMHVRELASGMTIMQPVYDFVQHVRTGETVTVFPAKFIIVEGLFTLFNKLLWEVINFKVFLDLDDSERLSRRIERDIRERGRSKESVVGQWNSTVQPMYKLFIQPSRSFADLILSGGDPVDSNAARIRDYLTSKNIL